MMLKKSIYTLLPSLAFLTFRGKGGGGGDSTTTTIQKMDPEVREKWLEMYGAADKLAGEEYVPYQGENLAQFDPLQLQGFDRYENAVGTGYDTLGRALSTANTSAGYTPDTANTRTMGSTFEDYLNPYTGEVIDTTMADMERQRQMMMGDIAGSAQAANAFGGSRHGIAESETNRGFADEMGQISAQLRDQGFNTAMQGFMGDSALMQQGDLANQAAGLDANQQQQSASQLLAGLSGQERDQAFGDSQMLADVGSEKRAMAQSELDLEYAKFLEEQQHPLRQLEIVQGAFGLTPQITSTKGVTRDDSSKPDLWQNLADTFSDVRLKDNITKLNGYAYSFKSRPEVTTGGVMAQEVELIAPHLVNTDVETGYKRVNYEALVGVLLEAVKDLKSEVEGLKRG
jgi:hypothetical protein